MWILLPPARALAWRFAVSAAAVALAAAALLTVAALAEGRGPRIETLRAVALPLAAALGAAWTLGGWRAERADVAAAALGIPPRRAALWLALLAAPLLAAAPGAAPDPGDWRIAVQPGRVEAGGPEGAVTWRWTATGVERALGDGTPTILPPMPAPRVTLGGARPPTRAPGWALRCGALLLALGWLTLGATPPGPTRVVAAAVGAFAAGHLGVRLLGL